jgi:hypothetical protein
MSWLDDVVSFGSNVISGVSSFFGSNSLGSNIVKTVLTGVALNKVTNTINKSNDSVTNSQARPTPVDPGVRIQTAASTEAKIPVLYGTATFGGSLIDARMTSDNKIMYYCYSLCENTGPMLSTGGGASAIGFNKVYWNDQQITFKADGITADYMVDRNGTRDLSIRDLVKVYLYRSGSSSSSQGFVTGASGTQANAYSIVPGWDATWTLASLAFMIVRVEYSKEKGITGIGNMTVNMSNSMTMPGDVLYDMMTNTRYGAGIAPADIKAV